jgi:hypothetical protein
MAMLCASYEVTFNQAFTPKVVRRLADVTRLAFDVLGTSLETSLVVRNGYICRATIEMVKI